MTAPFKVMIPARFASSRFPGKVLVDIQGKPMIQHVYERALRSGADEVLIATDDFQVASVARAFGAPICMTDTCHQSGSDRLAEAADKLGWADQEIVVNVQADEPVIPPENIAQLAQNIALHNVNIATLCVKFESSLSLDDPNTVKLVRNKQEMALYFSRSVIPLQRDADDVQPEYYRHIGIYAYRVHYLKYFASLEQAPLELAEKLEQLRALWHGEPLHVGLAKAAPGPSVDTPEDLEKLLSELS